MQTHVLQDSRRIVCKTLGVVRFGTVRNQDSQAFSKWQFDAVFNQITRSS